ncbi:19365_t:CDS:1 [Funneliformis geosporum]|uniref:13265_t:CDS:1 n=1 Tax=Funneliformis geosporum TaxID=1117311 RepID=A0A9W4SUD7_9GLOM|nr:19365_t:CDS:1 [Funneliformis geosporum]CAI2179407.1 13265_t:CDS:1 [Funneliformis geosporum]
MPDISSVPYPIRVLQYFTSPSNQEFFLSPIHAFYCVIYGCIIYWNMIWMYDIYLVIASCLLYSIQFTKDVSSTSEILKKKSFPHINFLIKLKIPHNYLSNLEYWLYDFLFHTPSLFNSPHLSCSPSEFWSIRWHKLYRNCFVELGYLPCKQFVNHYYPSSLPFKKELAHMFGVFAGFWWSALFHEYIVQSLFGLGTGEHFTLFIFHGIIIIVWEIITVSFKKITKVDQNNYVMKGIGFFVWNSILILSAPWFVEPYIRGRHYYCYPHFGCNKNY